MRLCFVALLFIVEWAAAGRGGGSVGRTGGGGSHSYPHSTGYSGYGSGGSHSYPHSNSMSGNSRGYNPNNYNYQHGSVRQNYGSRTEVHHHYHYSPPQQISYGSTYHPVYHGPLPVYVYEYRDSSSRFNNLLTGLALYNLGRMSANNHYGNQYSYNDNHYRGTPGEICKLGISKPTGEYEETRIDCRLMSSFIVEANPLPSEHHAAVSSKTVTTTITNVTHSGNGTGSGDTTSVTSVVVKNETVTNALDAKGRSIVVTPGMTCYMIRLYRDTSVLKKNVDCALLQTYAQSSMRRNNSERLKPVMMFFLFIFCNCFRIIF